MSWQSLSLRARVSFRMLSRMSGTWRSSWRKTLMRLTRLSRSSPARPCRTLFHFPSVAYASMRTTISWSAGLQLPTSGLYRTSNPCLHHVLIEYVTLLTNLEGPAPSAPTLTRKEIIDTARKEAHAAAIAAAAAAAAYGGDSGGDDGGDAAATATATTSHRGMVTRTRPPGPSRPPRRRPAAPRRVHLGVCPRGYLSIS